MKKQLLSLFAIMALGTNVLMAQNWTVPTTVPINNDFNINLPTRQGGQGAVKNGDSRVACANDTVMYALQKNIGTTVTGFNYNNTGLAGGGQYFMAPQQITVHGFTFYANAASAVNVTAKIFLAGADSLPTGTALATTSVAVTSATTLAGARRSANFTTPVSVNAAYVLTVETNSATNVPIYSNYFNTAGDTLSGRGEHFNLWSHAAIGFAWIKAIEVDPTYDYDYLFQPIVSYDVTADFSVTPLSICDGDVITFANNSSPVVNSRFYNWDAFDNYFNAAIYDYHFWNMGDLTLVDNQGANVTHTYATNGSYSVELESAMYRWGNSWCFDSKTESVTVNPLVAPSVTIALTNGNNPTCPGGEITYTATPTNGGSAPTYEWFVNSIPVGTGVSYTSDTYTDQDQVYVVMTSNANCLSTPTATSTSTTITVNPLLTLTPAVSIAASANPFCVGSSVTFTATPTNGGSAATYAWFVNGTQNMSSVTNSFSASLANLDEVYCEMTSSLACASPSNATSATITMNENPVVTPTVMVVPSANPICSGDAVTFTVTATNGGTTPSYQWAINGTNAGANSNVFASAAAGLVAGDVVSCEMTSNASCANPVTASDSETISVKPAVQGTFTSQESAPGEVDFSATAITGAGTMTYSWDFGDGTALGTGVTTSHTYTVNDDYTVVLSVTDECGTVAKTALVDFITLSINKHSDNNSVKVYPNPSNGIFNVSTSANATVVVYNAIGSVITTLTTTNNKLTLDLSNQANGIYFVKVLTNAETVVKKVNISR